MGRRHAAVRRAYISAQVSAMAVPTPAARQWHSISVMRLRGRLGSRALSTAAWIHISTKPVADGPLRQRGCRPLTNSSLEPLTAGTGRHLLALETSPICEGDAPFACAV